MGGVTSHDNPATTAQESTMTIDTYLEHAVSPVVGTLRVLDVVHIVISHNKRVVEVTGVFLLSDADQPVARIESEGRVTLICD